MSSENRGENDVFFAMCSWGGERNTIDEQLLCGDKTASSPEIILQNYTPLARTSFRDCQPLFVSLMALFHPGPNCLTSLQFEFLLAFLGRSSNIRHQVMLHHQKILRGLRFKFSQELFFSISPRSTRNKCGRYDSPIYEHTRVPMCTHA